MDKISTFINFETLAILTTVSIILCFFTLIFAIITRNNLLKFKKKYKKLVDGMENGDIVNQLNEYMNAADDLGRDNKVLHDRLMKIEQEMDYMISRIGVNRYNAFENVGSDLSFSIALLNNKNDGVVLSSLYGRDNSTVFAKPIIASESKHRLSDEEIEAIKRAKEKTNNIFSGKG